MNGNQGRETGSSAVVIPGGAAKARSRGTLHLPVESRAILSGAKDPQGAGRGPSPGTMRVLRLPAQDDKRVLRLTPQDDKVLRLTPQDDKAQDDMSPPLRGRRSVACRPGM